MYNNQTEQTIKNRILTDEHIKNTKLATNEGSITNNIISAIAFEEARLYMAMSNIFDMAFIEDSFDGFLDKRVNEFGIYRKMGDIATGLVKFTGRKGADIPNGTLLTINGLEYVVVEDFTFEEGVKDTAIVCGKDVGEKYNIYADAEFEIVDKTLGINTAIAVENFTSGVDVESDEEFKQRFYETQRNNATSGNVAHYEQWAKECDGVYRAKVTPLWDGPGTVKLSVSGRNNEALSPALLENCKNYIEEMRPIGRTVTITTTTPYPISISATIELAKDIDEEYAKAELMRLIEEYFDTVESEITYSKVYGIIAKSEVVEDCKNITVNGATTNITIEDDRVPILGETTFNVEVM